MMKNDTEVKVKKKLKSVKIGILFFKSVTFKLKFDQVFLIKQKFKNNFSLDFCYLQVFLNLY